MIIRVLDEEKANVCDQLLTKLIAEEQDIDNGFKVKGYFKNVIKDQKKILLSFFEDDIVKGYIYLKPIETDDKNCYLIDGLYVLKEYRNNGIAKKLLDEGLKLLKEKNISFVDISVMEDNKIAYNLYKKYGFVNHRITMRKTI